MARFLDRSLRFFGLQRISASGESYKAAMQSRLTADWAISILSADQEVRGSLTAMRARARKLARDNDYAARFLYKAEENVVGSNGFGLQMTLDEDVLGAAAEKINREIEGAWLRFSERTSTDGQRSFVDDSKLWIRTKLLDGECFLRKVKGYPHNPFQFALQFIDADQVDVSFQRLPGAGGNEIRLGIEVDGWLRPVAYWIFNGHPAERPGVQRIRIPGEEIEHAYIFRRPGQSRGIPWMHTAMTRMHMLGGYEEAELVGARLAACKMAAIESKTGEEYAGMGKRDGASGAVEVDVQPASMFQLPEGMQVKPIDWNHPNGAFPEFVRAMLRGAAAGLNASYSSLSGDLRDVNFSSLRQGVLDERDGWRLLQTFAIEHFVRPVFRDWLAMAITTGQLDLPANLPIDLVLASATWTARGWDWVDPRTDVAADMSAVRAGMTTLADVAAKRGKDWRDIIDQRAKEIAYAAEKGVPIDLSTAGTPQQQPDANGNLPGDEPPTRPAGASLMGARI